MKWKPRCILCELEGAFEQAKLSTDDESLRSKALREVSSYLSEAPKDISPAELGTRRNRIVKKITSEPDPYKDIKERMNKAASELEPFAREYIEKGRNEEGKLKRATRVAVIGNSLDFNVSEHEFDLSSFRKKFSEELKSEFYLSGLDEVISKISSSEGVVYLLDNCGEAILDRMLLERISRSGCDFSVAARSGPIQDDITLEEAEELNFSELGELLPAGRSTGVDPAKAPRKLKERLDKADLILSKGEGNFEMLSEHEESFRGRLAYLLMTKCGPVSKALEVPRESKVIHFVESS